MPSVSSAMGLAAGYEGLRDFRVGLVSVLNTLCYFLSSRIVARETTSSGLVAKLTTWQSGLEVRITVVFLSAYH
jgi:hypothetical protein